MRQSWTIYFSPFSRRLNQADERKRFRYTDEILPSCWKGKDPRVIISLRRETETGGSYMMSSYYKSLVLQSPHAIFTCTWVFLLAASLSELSHLPGLIFISVSSSLLLLIISSSLCWTPSPLVFLALFSAYTVIAVWIIFQQGVSVFILSINALCKRRLISTVFYVWAALRLLAVSKSVSELESAASAHFLAFFKKSTCNALDFWMLLLLPFPCSNFSSTFFSSWHDSENIKLQKPYYSTECTEVIHCVHFSLHFHYLNYARTSDRVKFEFILFTA